MSEIIKFHAIKWNIGRSISAGNSFYSSLQDWGFPQNESNKILLFRTHRNFPFISGEVMTEGSRRVRDFTVSFLTFMDLENDFGGWMKESRALNTRTQSMYFFSFTFRIAIYHCNQKSSELIPLPILTVFPILWKSLWEDPSRKP